MKDYISTIIYISIFSIILELILPSNKLKKYISSLMGVLVILTIASPVVNFLKNDNVILAISNAIDEISISNENVTNYDFSKQKNRIINDSVKAKLEEEIESSCKEKLDEYNIKNVSISLNEKYAVDEINIVAADIDNVEDARKIINYIIDTYNVQEQVINIIKGE